MLAADCVYFEPAFPLLIKTLCDLVKKETQVLFCYKKRRKASTGAGLWNRRLVTDTYGTGRQTLLLTAQETLPLE